VVSTDTVLFASVLAVAELAVGLPADEEFDLVLAGAEGAGLAALVSVVSPAWQGICTLNPKPKTITTANFFIDILHSSALLGNLKSKTDTGAMLHPCKPNGSQGLWCKIF
jgi:hypothetical protein